MTREVKHDLIVVAIMLLCFIAGCMMAGCGKPVIPPDSKCINNYVYYQASNGVWLMWRGQGYIDGVWCQSAAASAVGK